ncbi:MULTISPECIES: TetR/AcrR family transcriptional regulator [unclassified Ensifer]|uniref:TetR/AcrR family transcriptional regulator n=1 Tax=unclassified Ensifer TaxID=2633371 RepID=UPI0008138C96|nr:MULTISPECIES: TetR/AcrR family transcriptional regulator [unclassified Ensifer]OCP16841.1 TetR family transcriptional regulator [Ensifer sp. LC384]OCP24002.1 TetR family transcriptional regulator [Ensifer sp. LC54]
MSSRGRPRNFSREEALKSAMEIFWDKGFDNTSLADLTRVMGLNPPSLYAAFGSKAKLFLEAVDLYGRTDGAGIWEFLDSAPTAKEAVHELLRRSAENFTQWPEPRGCMVVLSAPQMEGGDAAVCDDLKARRLRKQAALQRRLERGVAEGDLPAGTACDEIAAYVTSIQHGMSIHARDGAARQTLMAIADCCAAGWDAMVDASSRRI